MTRLREESLSTHVLDLERGVPAAGVPVRLDRLGEEGFAEVGRGVTDAGGRIEDLDGGTWSEGTYRIVFEVAAYFGTLGREDVFLREVCLEFRVSDATRHYHVPLLLSPYGCSTYRGS